MITDFLLETLAGIILGLLTPLPKHTIDMGGLAGSASDVGATAAALNGYAPIASLGIALSVLLGLKLALLSWQAIVWIYHQFWGSN